MPRLEYEYPDEDQAREQDTQWKLQQVLDEKQLYYHPSWVYLRNRLDKEIVSQQKLLETAEEMTDLQVARGRIALARHLLGIKELLDVDEAKLRSELMAEPGDEDE